MASHIERRKFLATLGGGAAAWPLAARAQQPARLPTIGFLGSGTISAWSPWTAAFVQRLRELGWIEGRNVAIEYRWAEGRPERYAEIAAEFVQLKVDVIVTTGAAALAAKQTTSVIPIVFAVANDPIGSGLVAGLARPGGNVTGLGSRPAILPVNGSNSFARSSPICAVWRFWPTSAIPPPCWKWVRPRPRPARSVSKSSH